MNGDVWYAEVSNRKQKHLAFPSLYAYSVIFGLENGKGTIVD